MKSTIIGREWRVLERMLRSRRKRDPSKRSTLFVQLNRATANQTNRKAIDSTRRNNDTISPTKKECEQTERIYKIYPKIHASSNERECTHSSP